MFRPGVHTEQETIAGYLEAQLAAIRDAAHGLTDEQARATPTRSTLSVGGLVKHATYVMGGRTRRAAHPDGPNMAAFGEYMGSFALTDDESLESVLAAYDEARRAYLEEVRSVDPDAASVEPPAPWDGLLEPTPIKERYYLLHHVEEFARHAGHADIIREQLDGATGPELHAAVLDLPPNDFVKPWRPPQD